jgi:pilus assembly protein CpaF
MLQAMSTGHDGSLATVHANSAEDALMRLQTLGSMSEVQIPFEALKDQINSAVDVVVQLTRHADGSRKVTEIALVVSHGREQFRVIPVTRFVPRPAGPDRVVHGRFEHLPLPRTVAEKLYVANEPLPPAFGVAEVLDVLDTRQAIG